MFSQSERAKLSPPHIAKGVQWAQSSSCGHRTSWCAALNHKLTSPRGTVQWVLGVIGAFSTQWHWARGTGNEPTCPVMPWVPGFPAFHSLHAFSQTHIPTILLLALHTVCFKCHTACSPMPNSFCPSLIPRYSLNYVLKDIWVKMSPPTHPHKYTKQT